MKRIPRRVFTAEFKLEAIKMMTEQGMTQSAVAAKLDIDSKSLRDWRAQHERGELKASLGAAKLTAEQHRIRELERELVIAKMERDILRALL
jgi:transposase-like protein